MISFRPRFSFPTLILAFSQIVGGATLAGQPAANEAPARPAYETNAGATTTAQGVTNGQSSVTGRKPTPIPDIPLPPPIKSPVVFFRELLLMTPAQRSMALSNRPPENRKLILAKVREYRSLSENERELRLKATELEWYLVPLMKMPVTNRAVRLASVPEEYQKMIRTRLEQWDLLPESVKGEVLGRRESLRVYIQVTSGHGAQTNSVTPQPRKVEEDLAKLRSMSENDRQSLIAFFNQYFELTPREKQSVLQTLSPEDQQQIEKSLSRYAGLTAAQRAQCISSFGEFAKMSAAEQQQFLKNAQRWIVMTPDQRREWREVVEKVAMTPSMAPSSRKFGAVPTGERKSDVTTNRE